MGGFSGSVGRYQSPRLKEPHHRARHQWQYWEDVISYISNTYPFWNRNGGADHIFVMMGDHGKGTCVCVRVWCRDVDTGWFSLLVLILGCLVGDRTR